METKHLNFAGRELPPYLGYGILDETSVRFENDVITADYVLDYDGTIVHRVTWHTNRCQLETFFHGDFYGLSTYPDLNKALSYDFLSRNPGDDKVFDFLSTKTSGMGNIYVQRPDSKEEGKQRVVFFPAGLLMCFRLPVPERTEKYTSFLKTINGSGHFSLHQERRSYLLTVDPALNVTIHPLIMAEFIVPLAYMTSAARVFAESGVINSGKLSRLMVVESYQAETSFLQTFTGEGSNQYFGYCYKEIPNDRHPELKRMFALVAKGVKGTVN